MLSEKFITDGTFIHWFLVREARSFRIFADVECKCEIWNFDFFFLGIKFH